MKFYLLPVSTRRTLLFCHRLNAAATEKQTLGDKVQERVAKVWAGWEKKESGWQKSVVNYGNYAFRRIPYEEWGLKSVPPLSKRRKDDEVQGKTRAEVVYPQTIMPLERVPGILEKLATEREALHKRKMMWCFIAMPFTAPVALIPVVPNLPFFYLAYRAWSHWRALGGGKHIQFLLKNRLLDYTPSPVVDQVYADRKHPLPSTPEPTTDASPLNEPNSDLSHPEGETMLLSQANGKKMTEALDLPQLEVELERAIWQVEMAIKKQNEELAAKRGGAGEAAPKAAADDATRKEQKKMQ